MNAVASALGRKASGMGVLLGMLVALAIALQGVAVAGDPCERRPFDRRSISLKLDDIKVTAAAIAGKVKYSTAIGSSSDTAVGVAVWVSYNRTSRGGLIGQQCIVIGDMKPGEERPFTAISIPEAASAGSFDASVAATEWR